MSVHSSHSPIAPNIRRRPIRYTVNSVVKLGFKVIAEIYIDSNIQTILEYIEESDGSIIVDFVDIQIEFLDLSVATGDTVNNNEVWNTVINEADNVRLVKTVDGRVLWALTAINEDGSLTVSYYDANNNQVFNIELDIDTTNTVNNTSTVNTVSLWFEEGDEWAEFFEVTVVQVDAQIAYSTYIDINSDTVIVGDRRIYRAPEYRFVSGHTKKLTGGDEWSTDLIQVVGSPLTSVAITGFGFRAADGFSIQLEEGDSLFWDRGVFNEDYAAPGTNTQFTGRVEVKTVGKGYAVATWRRRKPLVTRRYVQNQPVVTTQSFT